MLLKHVNCSKGRTKKYNLKNKKKYVSFKTYNWPKLKAIKCFLFDPKLFFFWFFWSNLSFANLNWALGIIANCDNWPRYFWKPLSVCLSVSLCPFYRRESLYIKVAGCRVNQTKQVQVPKGQYLQVNNSWKVISKWIIIFLNKWQSYAWQG